MIDLDDAEARAGFIIAVCLGFAAGIGAIMALQRFGVINPEMATAVEIVLYGTLWVAAIAVFFFGLQCTAERMLVPGIVASVVLVGCIAYAILSHDDVSWHAVGVGLVLAIIILVKGFFGAIAAALSLSLAGYALLHGESGHVPLIQGLMEFTLGQINVAFEYLTSIVVAVLALTNASIAES